MFWKILFLVCFMMCLKNVAGDYHFVFTTSDHTYNGTVGWAELEKACIMPFKPCTSHKLLENYFWLYNTTLSWVMDASVNCVGYTTDNEIALGTCLPYRNMPKQLTTCSCDMNIPVCCVAKAYKQSHGYWL